MKIFAVNPNLPAVLVMLATALLPFAAAFFPSTLIRILTQGASAQTAFVDRKSVV